MGSSLYHLLKRTSTDNDRYTKLLVEAMTPDQSLILDGFGYQTDWHETDIAFSGGTTRWAEFTVPAGFKLALSNRVVSTDKAKQRYRVFPEGTYTVASEVGNTTVSFARTRNLRQGSFVDQYLKRVSLSTPPPDGQDIVNVPIFGSETVGNVSNGGIDPDTAFLLLNGNQKFLLGLTNEGAANSSAVVVLTYGMIPDDVLREPIQ